MILTQRHVSARKGARREGEMAGVGTRDHGPVWAPSNSKGTAFNDSVQSSANQAGWERQKRKR